MNILTQLINSETQMENIIKKILISTALKAEKNMPGDKADMDIPKAKSELIEQAKKDAKVTTAECKQANEALIPMIQMIKALPKKMSFFQT